MTRRFVLTVLVGLLVATGVNADDAAAQKQLEGNWKLTRKEYKGNLWPSGFRNEGLFIEGDKIFWTVDGKEAGQQKGDLTIDATTKPASITVEITRGSAIGKKLLGIYEIKGNKLTICWGDTGSEKRPRKFITRTAVGAGTMLETYQKEKDSTETESKEATSGGTTDTTAAQKQLEGNWKLTRKEYKGNLWPSGFRNEGLFIEGDKIFWTVDRREAGQQKGDLTIDATTKPASITVEITRGSAIGKKLLGIYEIKGNKLTICWGDTGSEKRPRKFITRTAVGAGTTLETYQKEKE